MQYYFRTIAIVMLCSWSVHATQVKAVKLNQHIIVDGKLNESAWSAVPSISEFKQKDPNQGESPSERSEVWVAFDNEAIYIAARLHDSSPDSIMALLDRRDNLNTADWFGVFLDPYRDKRSGNYFVVGPAGTVADGVLYNDDWDDSDWDGVWEGKTNVDENGWTLEMRIPFSQLRFQAKDQQVWGINFRRDIGRKNEIDYLVYTPRTESGYVSRFPELVGIEGIKPANALEILPFATAKHERIPGKKGNPFNADGIQNFREVGADLKYGISSNIILDATINPDFGQVEVDPAVVNLSDVESFFQEKRPFFIEGANTFNNFGRGGGSNFWNFNFPQATFFYSRRIGRSPNGNDTLGYADFSDAPIATRILGAGKITGKLGEGWNFGTIHAVTNREMSDFKINNNNGSAEIEPQTYYAVGRIQKEINEGKQGVGFLGTYTKRNFSSDLIGSKIKNDLNDNALFAGFDGWTFLDDEKMWVTTGYLGMSRVEGSATKITRLQRNSTHYFQRPDADHIGVDSTAESLTGYTGRVYLIKQKGNIYFNSSLGFYDPGFEINDLGFLSRTDLINMHIGGGYNWTEPDGIFRRKEIGGGFGQSYDFQKNLIHRIAVLWTSATFMNFYSININGAMNPTESINNRRTRGGPLTVNKIGYEINLNASSDGSKNIVVEAFSSNFSSEQSISGSYGFFMQYRPVTNITVSIGPSLDNDISKLQYYGSFSDATASQTYSKRYVFSELTYRQLSANIRVNWTFTPTLSLQVFMQPLISSAKYNRFKELIRPKSNEYLQYGTNGSTITLENNKYTVDADGSGRAAPITINNPDFNGKDLRGNAVLRWEYLPGSALYLVWTQSRSYFDSNSNFEIGRSFDRLVNVQPDNIFLIKLNYYLNM